MKNEKKPAALKFIKAMRSIPMPKPKLKVADAKRLARAAEKMGKTVTAIEARADGSVAISIADAGSAAMATKPNPWDKVLPK